MFESLSKLISTDASSRSPERSALGTLVKSISISRSSTRPPGPFDPIKGRVKLKYFAPTRKEGRDVVPKIEELVGPLDVKLVLEACLKTKVSRQCDKCYSKHHPSYHGGFERHNMEKQILHLHNGPIRIRDKETLELEFETFYPVSPAQRGFSMSGSRQSQESTAPPSFREVSHHPSDRDAAVVEYRLSALVDIPLALTIAGKFDEFKRPLAADEARSLLIHTHGMEAVVTAEASGMTLPPNRPVFQPIQAPQPMPVPLPAWLATESQSLIQTFSMRDRPMATSKTALKSSSKPNYVFHIACDSVPKHISIGSPLHFTVEARPDLAASTIPEPAAIELSSYVLTVLRHNEKSRIINSSADVCRLEGSVTPSGPFSRSNGFRKTFATSPVILPSIEQPESACEFQIQLDMSVNGENFTMMRQFPITAHAWIPSLNGRDGSSHSRPSTANALPAVPRYEVAPPAYVA